MEKDQAMRSRVQSILDEVNREPEVAGYLKMPTETLRWHRLNGTGPRHFKVGRGIRYRRTDVLEWIDANVVADLQAG